MASEPAWLVYARQFLGLKEIPGTENNPIIVNWLIRLKAWWRNDETPWCGVFVAAVISNCGFPIAKHWYRARDWLDWGLVVDFPVVGSVVVFERKGGGHVGFVVGEDQNRNLMVLGGNQSNRVSIAPFDRSRVLGYRWPVGTVFIVSQLPLIESGAKVSFNEA